jgi:diguanylate cyclase (GGDEF)-like protein
MIYQPIFDVRSAVTGIFVQGNDVTEAYELGEDVAYQAAHDSLTGLFNRREFGQRTQRIEGAGPHALLYMDIDHFKIINDRQGHAAGDSLLIRVAELLKSACDVQDDLVTRFGGDEFALVRRNCGRAGAVDLADRLRSAVEGVIFMWQGKRYGVTMSIGVVNFGGPDDLSFDGALGLADAACFLAKEKGRNRVQVSSPTDEEVRQQQHDMDSVSRLKDAMREDRVLLYTQTIVPLRSHTKGPEMFCEVLARLLDLDGTVVPPGAFIPAAERFGLIEELDRHIVRKTFAHIHAQASGSLDGTCYFINLSGLTLSAAGFSSFVQTTLCEFPSVRASQICFEVTETAALSNLSRTADAMHELISKGIRFALDDFGSGMASFTYLRHLPVQFIKIDGEFIKAILEQPASAIIVEAVTKVAQTMNMQTIAESVESDDLIAFLRSLNVDYAQGFALHRPTPILERPVLKKPSGGAGLPKQAPWASFQACYGSVFEQVKRCLASTVFRQRDRDGCRAASSPLDGGRVTRSGRR